MDLLTQLNAYSARFARLLFAAHPEWQALAAAEPWPDAEPGCFAVVVPSPGDPAQALTVTTDGGEVTVAFGEQGWHTHFGSWTGADETTSFAQALAEVAGILAGRRVLAVCDRGGRRGSVAELLDAGTAPDLGGCERLTIHSWAGSRPAVA